MVVVGLDIGTQNIRVAVGDYDDEGALSIIGTACVPSAGLTKGVIVSIESAMNKIREVIDIAEQNAGLEITECVVSIGGDQIEGFNSRGQYAVSSGGREKEITEDDVRKVIEVAIAVQIPLDKEKLHVIPQIYSVDGIGGIKDPVTRLGVRLESDVHIITTSRTVVQNIQACVERAGYQLSGLMLKTLASTYAVVQQDELDLGSIIIDLGAGSTDILVVLNGAPIYTGSIPVCGYHVTNDIHLIKGISFDDAERIKVESGCCWPEIADPSSSVIIPGVGGRAPEEISQYELSNDIIYPRMAELFELVRESIIKHTNVAQLSGNIILTGAGANMEGVVELVSEVFNTSSVRIGVPENLGGNTNEYRNPEWSTAIGLVLSSNKIVSRKSPGKGKKSFGFGRSSGKKSGNVKDSALRRISKIFF